LTAATINAGIIGNTGASLVGNTVTATTANVTSGTTTYFTASNVTTSNLSATRINSTIANVTSGTITNFTATNITTNSLIATNINSDGYKFANGSSYIPLTIANTPEITSNVVSGQNAGLSLVNTGVTAGNYGSATSIPTIVVDAKGRISSVTTNAVSTTFSLAAGSGSGSVSGGGTLTVGGGTGITTSVTGSTYTITNSGVTSIVAGTDTSISGATGAVTVNGTSTLNTVLSRGATTTTTMTVGTILPSANLTYNIGSTSAWFNTFYGVSSQAQYADLAEKYTSDAEYTPGTVVVFGGSAEVTTTTEFADSRVAGAVSTDPAYLMNAAIDGVAVALRGRIPVKVIGPVQKGDLLVTSTTPGFAQSVGNDRLYGASIFAKSLVTDLSGGEKTIEAVVI
jgi:hypothetical protein